MDSTAPPRRRPKGSFGVQTPVSGEAVILESPPRNYEGPKFVANLLSLDRRHSKWVHENCLTDWAYFFLRFFEYSGDGLFWLPAAAAFWISPSAGTPDTRMFAANLFVSLIFDLIVVGSIKSFVRRRRPSYNRGHLVVVSLDKWSFPSGHSTRAAMVMTLFWLYTPLWRSLINQSWYPYLALRFENNSSMAQFLLPLVEKHLLVIANCAFSIWALGTICSRVVLGRHYILDVIGGVMVGMLEALVAHFFLHVPTKVSELQHAYLLSKYV